VAAARRESPGRAPARRGHDLPVDEPARTTVEVSYTPETR
jgi:hypothetical protein